METVVEVEKSAGVKFEDASAVLGNNSDSSKLIVDPVVYKLVRVEGDGRLVPATDDEVMEVENLLDDDKSLMHFVLDTDQTAVCTSDDQFMSKECQGLLRFEDSSAKGEKSNVLVDTTVDLGKLNSQFEQVDPSSEPSLNDEHIDQSGPNDEHIDQSGARVCADPLLGLAESEPSTSTVFASWKPDFSMLKGEICLDNLSVRELHATFKATFGRDTSVKDKQWLKRRIAMGLSNSCDVTTTTFIFDDNKVKNQGTLEDSDNKCGNFSKVPVAGLGVLDSCDVQGSHNKQMEDPSSASNKGVQTAKPKHDFTISEDPHDEQRSAKRVRKPTRRYIEEVSEMDCREHSGKSVSSVKTSGRGQLSPRTHVTPIQNIRSVRRPLVTRHDSLGGSGVEIPYVSRIRRGRPRENFMALMKFQPCETGMASKLRKDALDGHGPQPDNEVEKKELRGRLVSGWVQQSEPGENAEYSEKSLKSNDDVAAGQTDSSADDSDDSIVPVPTAKGGMRRKHHRPWTLSEVVKLVEGVARYGAGRWSEIKRVAFATYSYRTSVDLKDKWRNLLRASFTQLPAEKGAQNSSRKQSSIPIPAPILLRVRELAEMQSQATPSLPSVPRRSVSVNVNDTRSGFL